MSNSRRERSDRGVGSGGSDRERGNGANGNFAAFPHREYHLQQRQGTHDTQLGSSRYLDNRNTNHAIDPNDWSTFPRDSRPTIMDRARELWMEQGRLRWMEGRRQQWMKRGRELWMEHGRQQWMKQGKLRWMEEKKQQWMKERRGQPNAANDWKQFGWHNAAAAWKEHGQHTAADTWERRGQYTIANDWGRVGQHTAADTWERRGQYTAANDWEGHGRQITANNWVRYGRNNLDNTLSQIALQNRENAWEYTIQRYRQTGAELHRAGWRPERFVPPEIQQQRVEQLETTEDLNQALGLLFRRDYMHVTRTEENLLNNATEVADAIRVDHNIQPGPFVDRRVAWLGHFLRGEVHPRDVLPRGEGEVPHAVAVDANEIAGESQEPAYRALREAFLTRLLDRIRGGATR